MNRTKLRAMMRQPFVWGAVAIVVLLLINVIKDPTYLSLTYDASTGRLIGNLIDILRAAAPIMMIATGMTLVVATSGIDLSVGSVMVVAGAVAMEFMADRSSTQSVGDALLAVGLALSLALVLGLVNGVLVSLVGLQPFITTLVMMLAGRGLAKVLTGGQNTAAENGSFSWIANGYVVGLPVIFLLATVIMVAVALLMRRSALGLLIESIGVNRKAARMAGVRPVGLLLTVYAFSGVLAGVAGIFATATVMRVDVSRTGYQLELDAILAVVVGGTSLAGGRFSLAGAAVGSLLIATLDKTVVFLGVPSSATPAFKAVVIIALCLLQSKQVRDFLDRRGARRNSGGPPSSPVRTSTAAAERQAGTAKGVSA